VELRRLGFKRLDAPHLAAAEALNPNTKVEIRNSEFRFKVDAMLTTDDPLLHRATEHAMHLAVPVRSPVQTI
jgi:hypothetical protein